MYHYQFAFFPPNRSHSSLEEKALTYTHGICIVVLLGRISFAIVCKSTALGLQLEWKVSAGGGGVKRRLWLVSGGLPDRKSGS